MILNSYLFMSLRYLQSARKNSTIRTMMKICFFGIFISTFSLALIISVMKGFEQATYIKMQSIYPEIIIDADGQELDYESLLPILQDPEFKIAHFAPQQATQALLQNPCAETMPCLIYLKGIDPDLEKMVTPLESMLEPKNQHQHLEKLLFQNQIIIGKKLAQLLQISTGSPVTLLYNRSQDLINNTDFDQTKVVVAGIFDTGIDDFDTNLVFCSHTLFDTLLDDHGITQIYIKPCPGADQKNIIEKLTQRLQLHVYSWTELYTSLVSALQLEHYAMCLILLLIMIIASCNIISLLFMQITYKQKDVALCILFGLSLAQVRKIFLCMSIIISCCASITGLLCAWMTGLFLQNYRWIKLPDNIYYATHLPVIMQADLFLFIFFAVLSITFFASLLPLSKIKMKNIATILRNEV